MKLFNIIPWLGLAGILVPNRDTVQGRVSKTNEGSEPIFLKLSSRVYGERPVGRVKMLNLDLHYSLIEHEVAVNFALFWLPEPREPRQAFDATSNDEHMSLANAFAGS